MAVGFVQATSVNDTAGTGGAQTSAAFGSSTVTGNSIIIAIINQTGTGAVASITDTFSNTYARDVQSPGPSSGGLSIWRASNITGGASHTVTITPVLGTTILTAIIREYNGILTTSNYDQNAKAVDSGTTTAANSGATAPVSVNSELVIGAFLMAAANSATVAGSGFGNLTTLQNATGNLLAVAVEDKIISAGSTQAATATLSATTGGWSAICATYRLVPQFSQDVKIAGTTAATSAAFASTTKVGNTILVAACAKIATSNRISSVTDSLGNTYTRLFAGITSAAPADVELWACSIVNAGASHTVTVTAGASDALIFDAQEWSNLAAPGALFDVKASSAVLSATVSEGPTTTTTQADELIYQFAAQFSNATYTAGSGFTNLFSLLGTSLSMGVCSKTVQAVGTQSGTMTISTSHTTLAVLATLRANTAVYLPRNTIVIQQSINRANTF